MTAKRAGSGGPVGGGKRGEYSREGRRDPGGRKKDRREERGGARKEISGRKRGWYIKEILRKGAIKIEGGEGGKEKRTL